MIHLTLKIYVKASTKFFSECIFNFTAFTEVKEVIDEEAEEERRFSLDDSTTEDTWCVGAYAETKGFKSSLAGVAPVARAASKTIQGFSRSK